MKDCDECTTRDCGNVRADLVKEGVGGTFWFVTTRTCNFNCTYCFQGEHSWTWQNEKGLKKFITDEVIERSIELVKCWQKPKGAVICWYGGEPLLRFDLIKKWTPIIYKELPNIRTSITTNGSLITQEVMDLMDEYNIGMLFSLDGPPWIQDKQRVFAGGKPTWDKIDPLKIIKWKPEVEIAWQISPELVPEPEDLDWMIEHGFHKINFNINWLAEWDDKAQAKVRDFMFHAMSKVIQYRNGLSDIPFNSNWYLRIEKLIRSAGTREVKPCGTGLGMLSVTPEGDLYPSQEMGFMVHEPGKALGTSEFYRLGNVLNDPVWEPDAKLERIFSLRNDDMIPPKGRDCVTCPIRSISFGGCHCRYVGQDGVDPSFRYNVMPGWCQSQIAAASGGLLAFARYGKISLVDADKKSSDKVGTNATPKVERRPLSIVDLDRKLDKVLAKLEDK